MKKLKKSVDLASDIEHIVQKAKKSLDKEKVKMSNNQKVKGIRENRSIEKEARRKEEAFLLADANPVHQPIDTMKKMIEETTPKQGRFTRLSCYVKNKRRN